MSGGGGQKGFTGGSTKGLSFKQFPRHIEGLTREHPKPKVHDVQQHTDESVKCGQKTVSALTSNRQAGNNRTRSSHGSLTRIFYTAQFQAPSKNYLLYCNSYLNLSFVTYLRATH